MVLGWGNGRNKAINFIGCCPSQFSLSELQLKHMGFIKGSPKFVYSEFFTVASSPIPVANPVPVTYSTAVGEDFWVEQALFLALLDPPSRSRSCWFFGQCGLCVVFARLCHPCPCRLSGSFPARKVSQYVVPSFIAHLYRVGHKRAARFATFKVSANHRTCHNLLSSTLYI